MICVVLQTATKILQAMKITREIHEKQSAQSSEVSTTQEDKSAADTAMDVDEGEGAGFDADTGMVVQLTRTKEARKRLSALSWKGRGSSRRRSIHCGRFERNPRDVYISS